MLQQGRLLQVRQAVCSLQLLLVLLEWHSLQRKVVCSHNQLQVLVQQALLDLKQQPLVHLI